MAEYEFSGKIINHDITGNARKYIVGVARYGYIRKYTCLDLFNAETGLGEQRKVVTAHAKKIKKAMQNNEYAPAPFTFGTRDSHRTNFDIKDGFVNIKITEEEKIPILNGGHRSYALEEIRSESSVMERIIDNLYIPYLLYLDGNPQQDFIVLQNSKDVSKDHMLSLKLAGGLIDNKDSEFYTIAHKIAKILHTDKESFCRNLIQFDSHSGKKLPLSLNSICRKAASDSGFSLYGSAKIAKNYSKDADWMAQRILDAHRAIEESDECYLLEQGNVLAPEPSGTVAGTSLIFSMGNMLACRLMLLNKDEPDEEDLDIIVKSASANLNINTKGNTSSDRKRSLLKDFSTDFFKDLLANSPDVDYDEDGIDVPEKNIGGHEGIPVAVIRLLSPSTFNVSKLPTETKKRGRKKKNVAVLATTPIDDDDIEVSINSSYSNEDPIDAEAFKDMDEEKFPWDDDEDEV